MRKKRSYKARKIYAEHYGITIPDGMEIHHIDGDPTNDEIENLLMLPRELHKAYHKWKACFDRLSFEQYDGLLLHANQFHFMVMMEFGKVCEECLRWMGYQAQMDLRNRMDGGLNG